MSIAYSNPFTTKLCAIKLYNEIQTAFNDWKLLLGQEVVSMFVDGDAWQKWSMWRGWQEWLEANCINFVDPDKPFNEGGSTNYYTLATWRVAAGLNANGFTRKYKVSEGVVGTAYGLCQDGDYIAVHSFLELHQGFEISDEPIPPPPPPGPPTKRFIYKFTSASCVSVSSGKIFHYGTETWFPASNMVDFVKANVDAGVVSSWPQGLGGPCVGANTSLNCHRTSSWGGVRSGGVEAGEGRYTIALTEEQLINLHSAQLVVFVAANGVFEAYSSGLDEGFNFIGEYTPDEDGILLSDTIGNVNGILGGDGVNWCDTVCTDGYVNIGGYDYYWESCSGSKGFAVTGAGFLLAYELTNGTYE